jgi:hypothetical protein
MYLVLFLDQHNYEFNPSLHASREEAEACYRALLQHFGCKLCLGELADNCGEAPHIYRIEVGGELGEEIYMGDLATTTA